MSSSSASVKGLLDLELEVLVNILEYVDDGSKHTSKAVARASKHLNAAVRLVRYRNTAVYCDTQPKFDADLGKLLHNGEFLRGVRVLSVGRKHDFVAVDYSTMSYDRYWLQLIELLGGVARLKKLVWQTSIPIPPSVLLALETHHPAAKLEVVRYKRELAPSHDRSNTEMALASSTALSTFSLSIYQGRNTSGSSNHTAAQHIAARAPNLKSVTIVSNALVNPISFGDWSVAGHHPTRPNSAIRHLTLDGWPVLPETLDYWAKLVDLSKLETFKCTRGILDNAYFVRAATLLTGLKHISLNLNPAFCDENIGPSVEKYIAACSPLESLSIWTWRGNVDLATVLTKHGATLKNLDLHEREENGAEQRQVLSLEELKSIREACPNLKVLTTDLERKSTGLAIDDHKEFFDELKKFNLDKLQIYFDVGLKYASLGNGFSRAYDDDEDEDEDDEDGDDDGEEDDDDDDDDDNDGDNDNAGENDQQSSETPSNPLRTVRPNPREVCGANYTPPPRCGPIEISIPIVRDMIFGYQATLTAASSKVTLLPPPSGADVTRFSTQTWKYIFGSETHGSRQLDLKFGEWERKAYSTSWFEFPGDLRSWVHIVPHERDDYAAMGRAWVTVRCPENKHVGRFSSE